MTPPAGPLVQKQITVIQVPTLDKNKDKASKAVVEMSKEDLMQAVVSITGRIEVQMYLDLVDS